MPEPFAQDDAAHFHIAASEAIIFAPDIYVDAFDGVRQQVDDLQAEMEKDFRGAADPKQATGVWIGRWYDFLRVRYAHFSFYSVADYVEGEMRRVLMERQRRVSGSLLRTRSRCANDAAR